MKLDFKILWVEDNPDVVVEDEKALRELLHYHGFEAIFKQINGYNEVHSLMQGFTDGVDDFDLILVDLDLGESGGDGGNAAKEIREHFRHREMVFYTGNSNDKLKEAAIENDIQGVYYAQRSELSEEAGAVIENMLRKIVDLSHMRGIVMAETSELDHYLECSLENAYRNLREARIKGFHDYAVKKVKDRLKSDLKKLDEFTEPGMFVKLLKNNRLMTSHDKLLTLMRYFKSETNHEEKEKYYAAIKEYKEDFPSLRNTLAHGVVVRDGEHQVFRGRGVKITEDKMREWRVKLMDHRDNIKLAATALGVDIDET